MGVERPTQYRACSPPLTPLRPSLAPPGERGEPHLASGLDQRVHGATVATVAARQEWLPAVVVGSKSCAAPPAGRYALATSQKRGRESVCACVNGVPPRTTKLASGARNSRPEFLPNQQQISTVPGLPSAGHQRQNKAPLSALARVERGWGIGGVLITLLIVPALIQNVERGLGE